MDILQSFNPPQIFLSHRCRSCAVGMSIRAIHPIVCCPWILVNVVFCNGLHLLQKEASLMNGESYIYLFIQGQQGQYLGCI